MQVKPVIKDRYKSLEQISEEIFSIGGNEITWAAKPEQEDCNQIQSKTDGPDEFTTIIMGIKEKLDQLSGQLNVEVQTPEFEFNKANALAQLSSIQENLEDIICNLSVSSHTRISGEPVIISVPLM